MLAATIVCAVILILNKLAPLRDFSRKPALVLLLGAAISLAYRLTGGPFVASEWIATAADAMLAAVAFAAAAQFRISELARSCPASFRLTLGGAPLFLVICGFAAFSFAPGLTLPAAFLVAGALTLNGAAFDRRAVTDAPAPAVIKAAVRLESAAILALGLPIAVILEAAATAPSAGAPVATPLYVMAKSLFFAFGIGGSLGLALATYDNKTNNSAGAKRAAPAVIAAFVAAISASALGFHPVVAAAAAGLLWGEQTNAPIPTRVRIRSSVERAVSPIAFFAFGAVLAPRLLQADLLTIMFAIFAVTIMRAGPRLISLRQSGLPEESQRFLAWFGGAPGVASALYLMSLFDAPSIVNQDTVLTVGATAVLIGVLAARATSKPLLTALLKQTRVARKRRLFAENA